MRTGAENLRPVANRLIVAYTVTVNRGTKPAGPACLGFTARLLSRVISRVYDDSFAEAGLKVSQFSLLSAIANQEDTRPAELAKSLAMDESTLSRNVARMCARGWLHLEPGNDDRRSHQITVTEKGMALLRKSYPAWQKAQTQVAERIGPEGIRALKSIVKRLRS